MSALKEQLTTAMKDAMRAKDKARLGVVRMALSAIKQIEVDERIELDDERSLAVLDKLIKQRKDSATQYRDAGRDDNPIHTDPAVAAREGLAAPIAGGSHVLSFVQSRLMEEWGPECLLHGAHFDVRWIGQTYAESHVVPRARVVEVAPDRIGCDIEVDGEDRPLLRGKMMLPLAGVSR